MSHSITAAKDASPLERAVLADPSAFRILTGDRPTGPLHVGHYFGTLENRVRLQNLGAELLVVVADYQAITDRDAPARLRDDVEAIVLDYLAVGIDPERALVFRHSDVPELNQLMLPFLSLVSVAELGRNPTVKEEMSRSGRAATSALMFTYPVHQAADILFCHANLVPVGKDQLPHVELARTVARRFNERYSPDQPYFAPPEAVLGDAPLLLGLDGAKMGKSGGNAIPLAADADETRRLVMRAKTDGERRITFDPERRPEVSNLLRIAALCQRRSPEQIVEEIGDRGAAALKHVVIDALNERLRPVRAKRRELEADRAYVREILRDGGMRARAVAARTLQRVHELMHTDR